MAYLSPIIVRRCEATGCTRKASQELRGTRNDVYGVYCSRHGAERLRWLIADESNGVST